jgi:hypothetical protein
MVQRSATSAFNGTVLAFGFPVLDIVRGGEA